MMENVPFRSLFRWAGKRLFVKIFFVFWLAMSVTGIVLLAIEAERTTSLQTRTRVINGDAIAFYAVSIARDQEDEQSWESRTFLKDLESRTGIRGWLFDAAGREISGHKRSELRRLQTQSSALTRLRVSAQTTGKTVFEPLGTTTLVAHAATGPSGKHYIFVGILPQARFGPWNAQTSVQALRLLAVLVTAGLVSWILALHLTRPIENLRNATHRLAQGDLSARATPAAEDHRDELGELARDFNAMAERLETAMSEQSRLVVAQKRLLGDVAHELRSPLARIQVALELARDASGETNDGSETHTGQKNSSARALSSSHDRIELEVGRLSDLIGRLLTLSRLESGVQKRDNAPIDLFALAEDVAEDADYEARPTKRVTFTSRQLAQATEADSLNWIVRGTPDLLRSAVENIVRNAVRHTPDETVVEVMLAHEARDTGASLRWSADDERCYVSPLHSTFLPAAWAVVGVRDHGPGLETNEMSEVFRPFYRAGKGRAKRDGGIGLGLAITLRAVELHGGQVRACNSEDGGLLVEIRLPLSSETESQNNV